MMRLARLDSTGHRCSVSVRARSTGRDPSPQATRLAGTGKEAARGHAFRRHRRPRRPAAAPSGYDDAYIAHLWEHPSLCLAFFGVQFLTPEGQRLYEGSGIHEEMVPALGMAQESGLLLQNRVLTTDEGPVLMQYWRSYEDLDSWARQLPHMRWWRWLLENAGTDLSFYHEIYQVKAAEAIYEKGCQPVGPARFVTTSVVAPGEGRSKDRQSRFSGAAGSAA